MLLALSDEELAIVMDAATPLRVQDRDAFMRDVTAELAKHAVLGPGIVGRIVRDLQRRYFDPPNLRGTIGMHDRRPSRPRCGPQS